MSAWLRSAIEIIRRLRLNSPDERGLPKTIGPKKYWVDFAASDSGIGAARYPEPSYCLDARRESQSSHFNAVTIAPPVMPEIPRDVFIQEFQAA